MDNVFFKEFLMLSDIRTLLCLGLLVVLFIVMNRIQK